MFGEGPRLFSAAVIELAEVQKSYPMGGGEWLPVLDIHAFSVPAGDRWAIAGPSTTKLENCLRASYRELISMERPPIKDEED